MQKINTVAKILEHHYRKDIFPWYNKRKVAHFWRLWLNETDGGVITQNGEKTHLQAGHIYIMPGYLPFSTDTEKPFSQFYIHFVPGDLFPQQKKFSHFPADEFLLHLLGQYRAVLEDSQESSRLCLIAHCILNFALLQLPPDVLKPSTISDSRIKAAVDKIIAHPELNFSNEELAAETHLSINGFLRLFRENTGESPQRFSHRKKFEYAAELLITTALTIEEIAEKTGFANRYHFSRQFAKQFGRPPAFYRSCFYYQE